MQEEREGQAHLPIWPGLPDHVVAGQVDVHFPQHLHTQTYPQWLRLSLHYAEGPVLSFSLLSLCHHHQNSMNLTSMESEAQRGKMPCPWSHSNTRPRKLHPPLFNMLNFFLPPKFSSLPTCSNQSSSLSLGRPRPHPVTREQATLITYFSFQPLRHTTTGHLEGPFRL